MKKIISILRSIIMLLGSVNVVFAESTTANPTPDWVCLRGNNTLYTDYISAGNPDWYGNKFISFIKFDFTDYLPLVYLSDSIIFSLKSQTSGDTIPRPVVEFSIVSDGLENYDKNTITYNTAGNLLNAFPVIYSKEVAFLNSFDKTSNIKTSVIEALESGENNTIVIKVSTSTATVAYFHKDSAQLDINYDTETATDDAYYNLITDEFDFDSEANVSSNAIADDFTLPSFYKGSNITWTSGNTDVISITGNNATVTRQREATEVKLTATFSYKEGSGYTKDYTVTVAQMPVLDILAEDFASDYKLTDEDYGAVTTDINLASSYNGANLTWTSSNINVVHPVTGKVYRPADADAIVSLTPTISSDGDSRVLNPINITVKKYNGKVKTIGTSDMATINTPGGGGDVDSPEDYLNICQGIKPGAAIWYYWGSVVKFNISDFKEYINEADSIALNLTTASVDDFPESERHFNIYLVNNNWDNTLTYNKAYKAGLLNNTPAPYAGSNDGNLKEAIYSSPVGCIVSNTKYTTTDILPAIKAYIADNPDATEISFMLQTNQNVNSKCMSFYGTAGTDAQKPSLEIRYNFETPSFEAVKNTDNTYSAVIKTNDAISGSYNVYFAAYSSDNALVGIDVIPDVTIESGATRINANAQKFVTEGATKIKCIITKDDGITPLWKNDELKLD